MSRPFPPVHHGTACLSQKSLTTTNISAATACLSLISCRGDIFRVSKPLWRGRRAEPIPPPLYPTPLQPPPKLQSNMLCSFFTYSCCTVSCSWVLMVSLTICTLYPSSHIDTLTESTYRLLYINKSNYISIHYCIYQYSTVVLYILEYLNMYNNRLIENTLRQSQTGQWVAGRNRGKIWQDVHNHFNNQKLIKSPFI